MGAEDKSVRSAPLPIVVRQPSAGEGGSVAGKKIVRIVGEGCSGTDATNRTTVGNNHSIAGVSAYADADLKLKDVCQEGSAQQPYYGAIWYDQPGEKGGWCAHIPVTVECIPDKAASTVQKLPVSSILSAPRQAEVSHAPKGDVVGGPAGTGKTAQLAGLVILLNVDR